MSNIFKVYKQLVLKNTNVANISDSLGIKPVTVYKYLDLFKKAGFKLLKIKTVHRIVEYSDLVKLSDAEMGLIAYLKLLSFMLFSKNKNRIFSKLIDRMLEYTNEKTSLEVENKFNLMKKASNTNLYKEKLELFEKFKNLSRVLVFLKGNEKLVLRPLEPVFKNKKIFFNFMDDKNKEIREIEINKIVNIAPFSDELLYNSEAQEVIFELYGRLAKVYVLKEGERVVNFSSDKLTIANNASDKGALFKRLLRYDTLCKIKFPKKDSVEFQKLIEKSLENIESISDNIL